LFIYCGALLLVDSRAFLLCGCGALLFINSATLLLIDNAALLLISGVTFLLTLWLTEALASVGRAPHKIAIL